jgi:hypothetical protein
MRLLVTITPGRTQHEQVPARSVVRARLAVDPIGELGCTKSRSPPATTTTDQAGLTLKLAISVMSFT